MRTSQRGVDLIKSFEGCRLAAYKDVAGIWTIGYGHTGIDVNPAKIITEEDAEHLLRADLIHPENTIHLLVKVPLNQNQFDALVSLIFNIGSGNFGKSTLLRKINVNAPEASEHFLSWNKARVNGVLVPVAGLTRRRQAEKLLFDEPFPDRRP